MRRSKHWLYAQNAKLRRTLKASRLASEEELAEIPSNGLNRSKDDLWDEYSRLKNYARRLEFQKKERREDYPGASQPEALDVALDAMRDAPETVHLPSIDLTLPVVPASYARILRVEDCEYWLHTLTGLRLLIKGGKLDNPLDEPHAALESCREEIEMYRRKLFAEVTAPGPAPFEGELPTWPNEITLEEERLILQAWHRVNLDRIRRVPKPSSKDGKSLPNHFSFLFESYGWKEDRAPKEIIENRSLAGAIAAANLAAIRQESQRSAAGRRN